MQKFSKTDLVLVILHMVGAPNSVCTSSNPTFSFLFSPSCIHSHFQLRSRRSLKKINFFPCPRRFKSGKSNARPFVVIISTWGVHFKGIRTGCKRKLSDLQKSSLFICGWRRLGSRFVPPSAVLRSSTWSVPEPSALRQWKLAGGAPRYCLKNENSWGIWRRFGQRPFLMWCFAPYHLFAPFSFNSFIILFVILMC